MQVQPLMPPGPRACGPNTHLCEAVQMMWEGDPGALRVIDGGVLRGILTDRGVSIALGARNRPAAQLRMADVMSRPVHTCRADEDVGAACRR